MQPYLKWPGGKRRQQERIRAKFGQPAKLYVEPFLGAGAVFFARAAAGEFESAIIADVNPRLMACHRAVRDDVEEVIRELGGMPTHRGNYVTMRDLFNREPEGGSAVAAASFIWLNRACFNGLYRENRKGEFNVPSGSGPLNMPDPDHLRACSKLLQKADLLSTDFSNILGFIDSDTRHAQIYADPPYVPVSPTASFSAYAKGGFNSNDQRDLEDYLRRRADRGAKVITSNSDTPFVRDLYKDWSIDAISETRAINSVGAKRGPVGELLISRNCEV
jgi:DNA adenine methylase